MAQDLQVLIAGRAALAQRYDVIHLQVRRAATLDTSITIALQYPLPDVVGNVAGIGREG